MPSGLTSRAGARPSLDVPRLLRWVIGPILIVAIRPVLPNNYEVFNGVLLAAYFIAVLGLDTLLAGGLFSMGQGALFALGAYVVGSLTVLHHVSFWIAWPLAGLLGGMVGLVLGAPALRLGTFTLAMVTLGYTLASGPLLINFPSFSGGADGLGGIRLPSMFSSISSYYWLAGAAVLIAYGAWWNLSHSPFGRACRAIRERAVTASALGIDVYRVKLTAFMISGIYAAIAGGLYAPLVGYISPDSFTSDLSVLLLLMVVIGGAGTALGPLLGAVILFRLPLFVQAVTDRPGEWSSLLYGAILLASVRFLPEGLVVAADDLWERSRRWRRQSTDRFALSTTDPAFMSPLLAAGAGVGLRAAGVTKRLGGIVAVDGVDIDLVPGTVHALIGPNGAGKTTLLNLVSGFVGLDGGSVALGATEISGMAAFQRVRRGLGRTFQTPLIVESMSCIDNVLIAGDTKRRHGVLAYLVGVPGARVEASRAAEQAEALLVALGLGPVAHRKAAELPQGARRTLEIARLVAMQPQVLLMDEPASGLSAAESTWLEEFIRIARQNQLTILLIEHNIDLVMRVADTITVLNNGRMIARGAPDAIRNDPAVIEAFLGDPALEAVDVRSPGAH